MTLQIKTGLPIFMLFILASSSWVVAEDSKMTAYELSRKVMAFHNTYQEAIAEVADELIIKSPHPEHRLFYQGLKVMYVQSSLDIASASDAAEQLLDMLVMLRLQKLVWQNQDHGEIGKSGAPAMSQTLERLEKSLHVLALKILPAQQLNSVLKLAQSWKRQNPDRRYIAFVRFTDMDTSREKVQIQELVSGGGLFSTISETNVEIEQSRHLMEKALFVSHHMPIMLEWQSELFLYKVFSTGEIKQLLRQTDQTTKIAEGILLQMEKLPDDINQVLKTNRSSFVQISSSLEKTSSNLKSLSADLVPLLADNGSEGDSLADVQQILNTAQQTAEALQQTMQAYASLSYNPETAEHVSGLINQALQQTDRLLENRMLQIDSRLREHRESIFQMLMAVVFIFPIVFFAAYIVAKRMTADKH